MNAAEVARHELIGRFVAVDAGPSGLVVDETKNTFLVETPSGVKRVPKPGRRFHFRVGNADVVVDGNDIMFRPEDRTKKVRG
jgi:ribonuclease P protein subunit POP4